MTSSALVLKCIRNSHNFYLENNLPEAQICYFNQLMYTSCLWWTRLQKDVREDGTGEENQGVEKQQKQSLCENCHNET